MKIGQRLLKARNSIGYTLEQASQKSGIGPSSLSEFENDKREPKFSQLSKLAEIYKKTVEYFLSDTIPAESVLLWRCKPQQENYKEIEEEFRRICRQYYNLETILKEVRRSELPVCNVSKAEWNYRRAEEFADQVRKSMDLGEIPSASLKQILEERCCVKIFHLFFLGSAISTIDAVFGPAVLLNKDNKAWRRNYDLAHELFHLLTWNSFRLTEDQVESPEEDKLADTFASYLLLPTDSVKRRIEASANPDKTIGLNVLDEIAREYAVSLEALLWRFRSLYGTPVDVIQSEIGKIPQLKLHRPERKSDEPDMYPERYCSLAIRALNEGRLSLLQFAKYMGLTYKEAQNYLKDEQEEFRDEKVSISVA
jgi:Zn-dependent peptidase ImmA (M78 family)/transcriptional regulator with XRE-family HTH domain